MVRISILSGLLVAAASRVVALPSPAYDAFQRSDGGLVGRKVHGGDTKHGGVASETAECSQIGVDILKEGGNAADAIIATGLCVGVISAYHSGIGGGGFLIVRFNNEDGSHGYEQIDFRESMPAAGNETMYASDANGSSLSTIGGLANGVPGELRGWEKLHNRHGKLPWTKLFQPAIKLAREGFKVNVDLADAVQQGKSFILKDPLWAETYAPNGTLVVEGDTIKRRRYADTLEKISWYGAGYFYSDLAVNTASASFARGGILSVNDLQQYEAIVRETVNITYRGARIFSTVAPSSGAVVLSALKIFEGYPGNATDPSDSGFNLTTHRLLEATQFAYGQRTQYADPAFVPNVTELQELYLQDSVVEGIRAQIRDDATFPVGYYDPSNYTATRESGTSHLAAIDGDSMAVSLTTTVNTYWGSQVMTADGVILNNEMDDFSSPGQTNSFGFAASPANFIKGGKRPLSSISSSIAEDLETGEILIATGSAGGSRIITTTLQYLHHYLDAAVKPTAHELAHTPRWHDQLSGQVYLEWEDEKHGIAGFDNSTAAYLKNIGYNITYQGTTGSTGHVVIRSPNGTISAANDPRKAAGGGVAF